MQKFPYAEKHVNPYEFDKILNRWDRVLEQFSISQYVSTTALWLSCENEHRSVPFDYHEFSFIANLMEVSLALCFHMEKVTKLTYTNKTVAKIFKALFTERCKHWVPFSLLQEKNHLFLPSNILSLQQLRHRFGTFQSIFSNPSAIALSVSSTEFFEEFLTFALEATFECDSTTVEDS